MELTAAIQKIEALKQELADHNAAAADKANDLKSQIARHQRTVEISSAMLDQKKIDFAYSVLEIRGRYERAGEDRESVIRDAVAQIATGIVKDSYSDLRSRYFGTKSYAHWHGQRSDHPYGYGPKHGSTIFSVGLHSDYREGGVEGLTDEQREAAIYLLTRLEAVQAAEDKAVA